MLAIQKTNSSPDKCAPNILPCRIHHDGPTKVTKRYWSPCRDSDGSQTSYFRGRKLRGSTLRLPPGYHGVVAKSTQRDLPQPTPAPGPKYIAVDSDLEIEEDEDEPPEPVKILEVISTFDDMVVWGHDRVPESDDHFIKGVQEWISFAHALHGTPEDPQRPDTEKDDGAR